MYVPVVTLSPENNNKLLKQIKTGFKTTIKWNICRSEMSNQTKNNNLNYLFDPTYTKVNRFFVLSFENERGKLHEKKNFRLMKICEKDKKDNIFVSFACFRFRKMSYFLVQSNDNVRKQHLSANGYSCINMKFSYAMAVRKYKTFFVVLSGKQALFGSV